jgi:hypothetical protein
MANDLLYKASLHFGASPQNTRSSLLHKIQTIGNSHQRLKRQKHLIEKMKSKFHTIADKRWLSTGRTANWFVRNRIALSEHLEGKYPPCKPPPVWWLVIVALAQTLEGSQPSHLGSIGSDDASRRARGILVVSDSIAV